MTKLKNISSEKKIESYLSNIYNKLWYIEELLKGPQDILYAPDIEIHTGPNFCYCCRLLFVVCELKLVIRYSTLRQNIT